MNKYKNIELYRGGHRRMWVDVDLDGLTSLDGYTVIFTIQTDITDSDEVPLVRKTSGSGITHTGLRAEWAITAGDIEDLPLDYYHYVWYVEIRDPDSNETQLDHGTVFVMPAPS